MLNTQTVEAGERTHLPVNETARAFGLAQVRKSVDPKWPKFAVIYPDLPTRWLDTEANAQSVADKYNGVSKAEKGAQ